MKEEWGLFHPQCDGNAIDCGGYCHLIVQVIGAQGAVGDACGSDLAALFLVCFFFGGVGGVGVPGLCVGM